MKWVFLYVIPNIIDNLSIKRCKRKVESALDPNFVYICRLGNSETNLLMTKENIILLYEAESVGN